MKLYEYQAKQLFEKYTVPIPKEMLVTNPEKAQEVVEGFGGKGVVKAQVLVGGRGKAGGVKKAHSPSGAREYARAILSMKIKDIQVEKVLVSEAVDIAQEYYLSITVDRSIRLITLIASSAGGVDIEELAVKSPEKIHRLSINPLSGIERGKLESFLSTLFDSEKKRIQAYQTVLKLYDLFMENDCSLVEINPYASTPSDDLIALDAKIIIDDNALFKHPDIEKMKNLEEYEANEIEARQHGLSFVGMDGNIGCMVNGAGLAMATMDMIKLFGAVPANFLDVGGSSSPQKVIHAFEIITRNKRVKAILINIFGGITRCDDIAQGILKAREQISIDVPLVIRLIGTNEKEGRGLLKDAGIDAYERLTEAVQKVVGYAQ